MQDIKPSNVLMHEDGHVVIADFELASLVNDSDGGDSASTVLVSGTKGYMAPEVSCKYTICIYICN